MAVKRGLRDARLRGGLQHCVAVGRVRPEWPAAVQRLPELIGLAVVDLEGAPRGREPSDTDDVACFPAAASLLVQVSGCNGTNAPGFDGVSYLKAWPDGNTNLHPTPELFSSPLTGNGFSVNYSSAAFESDTPRIEAPDLGGLCNRTADERGEQGDQPRVSPQLVPQHRSDQRQSPRPRH